MGQAIVAGFLMLTGILCGIVALCVIPRYGAKGLLGPALTGLLLWLLLTAIAVPSFTRARGLALKARAAQSQRVALTPVLHIPGATRLQDAELDFSFDIASGYQAAPAESRPKQYRHLYGRPNASGAASVIGVSFLPGAKFPNQHLTSADIPAGRNASLVSFIWRGLPVDAFRVSEPSPQGDYVTFNVQIPLKKHTVQLAFGGPATKEAETRALAVQTLSSFDGQPNWP